MGRALWILAIASMLFGSCGNKHTATGPVKNTPAGAKVDLSLVSLHVEDAKIIRQGNGVCLLQFNYTLENQAGAIIVFPCLYNNTDELIEVNLEDKDKNPVLLGKRPLEGLTLTEPRPLGIPIGKTTRGYQVSVPDGALLSGDELRVRIRLHAPSRYDELRSSLEAASTTLPWP